MGRVLAVASVKGGSGKTTTAVHAASWLAAREGQGGKPAAVLVDLDPQGSATLWLGGKPGPGLLAALVDGKPLADLATQTSNPSLALIASGPELAELERRSTGIAREFRIGRAIADLVKAFPYVVLDLGPGRSLLSTASILAATDILSPVDARPLSIQSAVDLEIAVADARGALEAAGTPFEVADPFYLLTRSNRTIAAREVEAELRRRYAGRVLETVVRESTRLAEAPLEGQSVFEIDATGNGAIDYRAVFLEIEARWKAEAEAEEGA